MKRIIKVIAVILLIGILVSCFTNSGFAFDQTEYVNAFSNEVIKGLLPQILEQSYSDDEIDIMVWLKYTESFDEIKNKSENPTEAAKEFYYTRNVAFTETLPASVKVRYISAYSPIVDLTATKADIYKIAEMDTVLEIWEGEKYLATDPNADSNHYFNSTLTVDDVEISFLENEYYKVYADFYGKYFYEKFKNKPPVNKSSGILYNSLKTGTGERYITVILNEAKTGEENTANALGIQKEAVLAVCQSYPVAMIKIMSEDIDSILSDENVAAVYNAFPAATEPMLVNDAIMAETFAPTAADARKILRYSAKLDKAPENMAEGKKFFFMSDADLDGKITAADARIALRISAKLESGKTYYKSNGVGAFWRELYN